jgi:hypothetical protein
MELTLHSVDLLDVGGLVEGLLVAVVPNGHVGSGFCEGVGYCQPDTCSSTRDDGRSSLEGEERHHEAWIGRGHIVVVLEAAAVQNVGSHGGWQVKFAGTSSAGDACLG